MRQRGNKKGSRTNTCEISIIDKRTATAVRQYKVACRNNNDEKKAPSSLKKAIKTATEKYEEENKLHKQNFQRGFVKRFNYIKPHTSAAMAKKTKLKIYKIKK